MADGPNLTRVLAARLNQRMANKRADIARAKADLTRLAVQGLDGVRAMHEGHAGLGCTVYEACEDACAIARDTGITQVFTFNGRRVVCAPDSDPGTVAQAYLDAKP